MRVISQLVAKKKIKIKHENKINCFDYEFMFYNKFICSNC
jgi:hypothetical protein